MMTATALRDWEVQTGKASVDRMEREAERLREISEKHAEERERIAAAADDANADARERLKKGLERVRINREKGAAVVDQQNERRRQAVMGLKQSMNAVREEVAAKATRYRQEVAGGGHRKKLAKVSFDGFSNSDLCLPKLCRLLLTSIPLHPTAGSCRSRRRRCTRRSSRTYWSKASTHTRCIGGWTSIGRRRGRGRRSGTTSRRGRLPLRSSLRSRSRCARDGQGARASPLQWHWGFFSTSTLQVHTRQLAEKDAHRVVQEAFQREMGIAAQEQRTEAYMLRSTVGRQTMLDPTGHLDPAPSSVTNFKTKDFGMGRADPSLLGLMTQRHPDVEAKDLLMPSKYK